FITARLCQSGHAVIIALRQERERSQAKRSRPDDEQHPPFRVAQHEDAELVAFIRAYQRRALRVGRARAVAEIEARVPSAVAG
ncbi:MAG: hypothetical protein AAFY04_09360, partial [Pseudomonadota bacterium]